MPTEAAQNAAVLVLGFNRPYHLQAVLESLRIEGHVGNTHVWLDGTQERGEYLDANDLSTQIASRYSPRELRVHRSQLGVEKIMLDSLSFMASLYSRFIVLEDDCFPVQYGIQQLAETLDEVADRHDVFSVCGHHFGTEPEGTQEF